MSELKLKPADTKHHFLDFFGHLLGHSPKDLEGLRKALSIGPVNLMTCVGEVVRKLCV